MIEALDETIKQLLVQKTPLNLAEVDISFEVPNREWSGSIAKPTINVYLHDIRENVELRSNELLNERSGNGRISRAKLAQRVDLSYIITAWTTNAEDEHRLLWYVLATMLRYPRLPLEVLQPPLDGQPFPLDAKIAQPDSILRNAADVWTALDNQLKPVLSYVVTISLEPRMLQSVPEVHNKFLRYQPPYLPNSHNESRIEGGFTQSEIGIERVENTSRAANSADTTFFTKRSVSVGMTQYFQLSGYVTDAIEVLRPVQAEVVLVEQGLNVQTDHQGRYTFKNVIERSQYTFLVVASGYETVRHILSVPATSYDFKLQPVSVAGQV